MMKYLFGCHQTVQKSLRLSVMPTSPNRDTIHIRTRVPALHICFFEFSSTGCVPFQTFISKSFLVVAVIILLNHSKRSPFNLISSSQIEDFGSSAISPCVTIVCPILFLTSLWLDFFCLRYLDYSCSLATLLIRATEIRLHRSLPRSKQGIRPTTRTSQRVYCILK